MKKLTLRWTQPLPIELPRLGIDAELRPPTRGQMRRYYELQAAMPEEPDATQLDQLRGECVAIFCEGSTVPVDALTADEELDILWSVVALHGGHDPADAVALQNLLQKKTTIAVLAAAFDSSNPSTPTPSPSPAS